MHKEYEDEFAQWARSRQGALLRAAVLLTGDEASAQDLVQETLIRVADRWPRLQEGSPEGYARRILYRDAVSAWRRHRRSIVTDRVPDRADKDVVGDWVAGAAVRQALQVLTPKQRAVLVMRYYEDLSEIDIATVLGVSGGTVKSQAHAALRRLRQVLRDPQGEPAAGGERHG